MPKNFQQQPTSSTSLGDITYVLFKHKWKIVVATLVGAIAAAAYYFSAPTMYVSQAKLMVRYLVEKGAVDQVQNTTSMGGQGGEVIIQSELEILTSWDLAEKVGKLPGLEDLVPKTKESGTPASGAAVISSNLTVGAVKGSNIILVTFKHPNREVASKALDQLILQYFIKHLEIHRSKEAAKFVGEKVERSRTMLRTIEDDLTKLKNERGILSLPDSIAAANAEVARAQTELYRTEGQLVEQRAKVAAFEKFGSVDSGAGNPPGGALDAKSKVNDAPPADSKTGDGKTADGGSSTKAPTKAEPVDEPSVMPSIGRRDTNRPESEYQNAVSALRLMESERMGMLKIYREEHEAVKDMDEKIARQQSAIEIFKRRSMEDAAQRFQSDLLAEKAQLGALEAKFEKLKQMLDAAQKNSVALNILIPRIAEKERARDIEEGNLKYMSNSLKRAATDEALDSSKIPNISIVQEATPAQLDNNKRSKVALGILGGTVAGTIGIILLFGLVLNRTINRRQELENGLGIPLLLSIPYFSPGDKARLLQPKGANSSNALNRNDRLRLSLPKGLNGNGNGNGSSAPEEKEMPAKPLPPAAPWEPGHFIRPFSEAARDRLGLYFEIKGITHKPKLIGVTSFSHGAGASTLAAGLAAALSETGEGKVLMVDMTANGSEGDVHPFFAGRPTIALDDAIKPSVQNESTADNLYLAKADPNSPGYGSLGLNKFRRIMSELQASDFDFMVFDMPILGQTSSTASIAGLMDQVLVIVEAEANSPEEVKRGFQDLANSSAKVSVVFNKARTPGPKRAIGHG